MLAVEHADPAVVAQQRVRERVLERVAHVDPGVDADQPIGRDAVAFGVLRAHAAAEHAVRIDDRHRERAPVSASRSRTCVERRVGLDRLRMVELARVDRRDLELLDRAIAADEGRDEVGGGMAEDLRGRVVLLEHTADVEDRDAVAHLHRFFDVVGHEHDGLLQLRLQRGGTRPAAGCE